MSINKPYHRIWRPVKGYDWFSETVKESTISLNFLDDNKFANTHEKQSLITTASLIIKDLYELFNYVEPHDANAKTFSHRIYELFLRTATEVESNCKGILTANDYCITSNLSMKNDYFKLNAALRLSEYTVIFERWQSDTEFKPFESWKSGSYSPLSWYKAYNAVKHDRFKNFQIANLANLMNAVAGLLCLLHAQFGCNVDSVSHEGISRIQTDQYMVTNETFIIIAPKFPEEEQYEFSWDELKNTQDPVTSFPF